MTDRVNSVWRLASRPQGALTAEHLRWCQEPLPPLGDRECLVRTIYLSLDPTNRIWASDMDQYMPPVEIGDVMRGSNLGVVEQSNNSAIAVGSIVSGMWGWQAYHVSGGRDLSVIAPIPGVPLTAYISVLGINGMTAYFGMFDVGGVRPADTVVISAAAGSVGSLAGQMAKIEGCRTVGIAGGDAKCRWLTDSLEFDAAVDYKAPDFTRQLGIACPEGVDLYFDNVGGAISDAVVNNMNTHGRIAVCGLISQYNKPEPWVGPSNYGLVLMRCLKIQGFLVSDYFGSFAEGMQVVGAWLADGRLHWEVDVVQDLENAPAAIARLFDGSNTGKLLVQCSPEPAT